jgi:hypothetical protein
MIAALIVMIVSLGVLYVVLPVVADTYRRLRGMRTVTCPETNEPAAIELDAMRAALRSAVLSPDVQVRRCSHWPEREHCGQECLAQVDPLAAKEKAA